MLSEVTQRDPEFVRKVLDLVESGSSAEEVIKQLQEEKLSDKNEKLEKETFPDEIELISQALAFRTPTVNDISDIHQLLCQAYRDDINGDEAFREFIDNRSGANQSIVSIESIRELLLNGSGYEWIVMECPNGREVVDDGTMIGVCCFCTDGVSRRNGEVEGKLGSIRYLGILRQLRGVCLGQRLLDKVENMMQSRFQCCRIMISVSNTRISLHKWLEARGYIMVGSQAYPVLSSNQRFTREDVQLDLYVKSLHEREVASQSNGPQPIPKKPTGKINMSPIWRMNAAPSSIANHSADVDEEVLGVD